jgi:heterodisulfide reductase subunit C
MNAHPLVIYLSFYEILKNISTDYFLILSLRHAFQIPLISRIPRVERMPMTIKISDKNWTFVEEIQTLSGQNISNCYQCGACSSGCPLVKFMDHLPATLIRLAMLGQPKILESKTIWVCSTCYTCGVRCPRDIDIAKMAEALRQMVLREKQDHLHLDKVPKDHRKTLPQIALVSSLRKFTG